MSRIEDALAKAGQIRKNKDDVKSGSQPSPPPPEIEPNKGRGRWQYISGISLVLAACFGMYRYVHQVSTSAHSVPLLAKVSVKTPPPEHNPAPAKAALMRNRLPASIPLNSADPVYSSAHPGWERYLTSAMDFRVFREDSTVKAIQVISRQKNAITNGFFTTFLGEIAGKDSFKIQSVVTKEKHYLEKGAAGDNVEIVVYREKPSGEISAIVVAFM